MAEREDPIVTAFDETKALWLLMNRDTEGARQVIDEMDHEEKSLLARQLRELHRMIAESSAGRRPEPGKGSR
jgi:hypothetical protein